MFKALINDLRRRILQLEMSICAAEADLALLIAKRQAKRDRIVN